MLRRLDGEKPVSPLASAQAATSDAVLETLVIGDPQPHPIGPQDWTGRTP